MSEPDVVADGGIKAPECGSLREMFGMCAVGAPTMPNAAAVVKDPEAQAQIVENAEKGDYGKGIQKTTNAIQNRMAVLNSI